jgi:preprotein translocase subunit SecA
MISLDDELMRSVFGGLLDRLQIASERLPGWPGRMLFGWALRYTVRRHSAIRKRLLHSDESLHDLLAFSGRGE